MARFAFLQEIKFEYFGPMYLSAVLKQAGHDCRMFHIRRARDSLGRIKAYDPEALKAACDELPAAWLENGAVTMVRHQYEALEGVDAMVLVTEWKPFRHPDFNAMKGMMKQPVIFDGRNQYDPDHVKQDGFEYFGIGRR